MKVKIYNMLMVFFFFCLTLTLTACGFRPRGEIPLAPPLHYMYLKSNDPYGQLSHTIIQTFKLSGVHFVKNPTQANVILEILSEDTNQQLLSVGGSQQTRQYNLILTVRFQLIDRQGHVLVPPQTLTEIRTIPIQTNQILAGSNEANNLYQQMRPALVSNMINRLSSRDVSRLVMTTS